jgi:3-oxoacyl-[acyl-carrier-protein] synthase II
VEFGLVTASTYSHLDTLIEYDKGLATLGMQRTNPILMPLGLPSAPGAATGLSLVTKAFSITLNDGGASGLAALGLAARQVAEGRAQVCVVAGAFTIFPELLTSAFRAGLLSNAERFRVFDRLSAGLAFGEAAAALVLETSERAASRGRSPLGFVRAESSRFSPTAADLGPALARACEAALRRARVAPDKVALACAGANGQPAVDDAHAHALGKVLGRDARAAVTAPKASLGESFDPSGLLQAIVALGALRARRAPPIAGFEQPRVSGLRYLSQATEIGPGAALLTSTSPSGGCSALVLS